MLAAVLVLVAAVAALLHLYRGPEAASGDTEDQPTVVLIVMDTVRSQSTSVCGYQRPTTPILTGLRDRGASLACRAIPAGGWTVPAHASFFTGLDVPQHGAHYVSTGGTPMPFDSAATVRPLRDDVPTIAELFRNRGYQTVALSANPLISELTGLKRGFVLHEASPHPRVWYTGEEIVELLTQRLRRDVSREQPLFLFVNLGDAHAPWWPVPDSLGWIPPTPSYKKEPYFEYLKGELSPDVAAAFIAQRINLYDYGVFKEDRAVGSILYTLASHGWMDGPYRVAIVGDHGEMLGDHDLIDHGVAMYEPNQTVPLLLLSAPEPPPTIPDLISATVVHEFLLEGLTRPGPVLSGLFPRTDYAARGIPVANTTWAALWHGTTKAMVHHGRYELYDLAGDPDEARSPTAFPGAPFVDAARCLLPAIARIGSGRDATRSRDGGAAKGDGLSPLTLSPLTQGRGGDRATFGQAAATDSIWTPEIGSQPSATVLYICSRGRRSAGWAPTYQALRLLTCAGRSAPRTRTSLHGYRPVHRADSE